MDATSDYLNRPLRTLGQATAAPPATPQSVLLHGFRIDLGDLDRLVGMARVDLRTASISDQIDLAHYLTTLRIIATVHGEPK